MFKLMRHVFSHSLDGLYDPNLSYQRDLSSTGICFSFFAS